MLNSLSADVSYSCDFFQQFLGLPGPAWQAANIPSNESQALRAMCPERRAALAPAWNVSRARCNASSALLRRTIRGTQGEIRMYSRDVSRPGLASFGPSGNREGAGNARYIQCTRSLACS